MPHARTLGLVALMFVWAAAGPARAQFVVEDPTGPQLGEAVTQQIKIGISVIADRGPVRGIFATVPVPIDWPEQQVRLADEELSPTVKRISYRMVGTMVQQMLIEIPYIPSGEARAVSTFEISRRSILPPPDPSIFVLPDRRRLPRDLQIYLGPSPYIESTHTKIRNLGKELPAAHEGAWQKVEAIYDWVREHVEYRDGPIKGAAEALQDGYGDCEELTSLFIAICRAAGIPARMVWVPGHCYPEFLLADQEGKTYWIPCQAAGTREFGGITEHRPILQKGDNFRTPERPRDRQRYVSEFLTGTGGSPRVEFLRTLADGTPLPQ